MKPDERIDLLAESRRTGDMTRSPGPVIAVGGKLVGVKAKREVDLVFVIDTTGSMSDKIDGLIAAMSEFIDGFSRLDLDHRIGIVAFGDLTIPGDRIARLGFQRQLNIVRNRLRQIPRYSGGANEGESSLEALLAAAEMDWRAQAVKVLVLVTDEPALVHAHSPRTTTDFLVRKEFLVYAITPRVEYFLSMAASTGGKWMDVASPDFSSLLNRLRQLATELSQRVADVHRLAKGNVQEFLRLTGKG